MNIEDYIIIASTAIISRPDSLSGTFHLCFFEGQLQCLPKNHTAEKHHIFRNIQADTTLKGLTSSEWFRLGREIMDYMKVNKLCLPHQKL